MTCIFNSICRGLLLFSSVRWEVDILLVNIGRIVDHPLFKCSFHHWFHPFFLPVNGGWGSWGRWSGYRQCTKTCGSGVQSRTRSRKCNNPYRRYGGSYCPGSSSSSSQRSCNTKACPGIYVHLFKPFILRKVWKY